MIELKNILSPTDFSEHSDHALGYAVEMAKRFGATIHLHHSVVVPYMPAMYEIGPDLVHARDVAQDESKKKLEQKAAAIAKDTGLKVVTHLTVGTPFVEIVNLARTHSIDLIIIATHGWGAMKQILLGSTAERVVRKAPCPVLTVKHPEHEFVMP